MASGEQALAIHHGDIPADLVPGTVHLVDLNHTLHTKHSRAHKDIVLVPTPSEDPDDPLNWTPRRKLLSLVCMCVYVWFTGICNSVVYSVLVPLSEANDLSVADLNAGTGYLVYSFLSSSHSLSGLRVCDSSSSAAGVSSSGNPSRCNTANAPPTSSPPPRPWL